jgi:hypothetical protein
MKKILILCAFCIPFIAFSQEIKRENISGKIIVEGSDIEGITIYNFSSSLGTVTNENGEFSIKAALNDLLEIRAIEYQKFDIIVNQTILETKKINIFLIDQINKLAEVVVTTKRLTGNLIVDIGGIKMFNPKSNVLYFGVKNESGYELNDGKRRQKKDIVLHSQPKAMVDGLNIINVVDQLLIPLFRSGVKDKKTAGIPEVPFKSIKYYLGSNFLVENFNVPIHRVEEFIRYVEGEAFDFDLLNYGHEIEFLELLNNESKTFLSAKSDSD